MYVSFISFCYFAFLTELCVFVHVLKQLVDFVEAAIIIIIIHSKYFPISDWLKPHA